MPSRKKAPSPSSIADAKIRELSHQISEAQKSSDGFRAKAKAAKAKSKQARKEHKQAKKVAKDARKKVKALKEQLHDITAAAAKAKRRAASSAAKSRKPSPQPAELVTAPALPLDVSPSGTTSTAAGNPISSEPNTSASPAT